ncbi:hypothetical protein U1Q18_044046 [Sarracenia purpurea var. burkii]
MEFLSRSPGDGPLVAFGGSDGVIRVLSMISWKVVQRYTGGHKGSISCLMNFRDSSGVMMPETAYNYVKSIWPRDLLASPQWQALREFDLLKVKKACIPSHMNTLILKTPTFLAAGGHVAFDDGSVVLVTEADLDGYDPSHDSGAIGGKIWADLSLVYRIQVTGQL